MDPSKVVVSPEHLRFERMGRNKKAALRRKNIVALIRSKPAGTPITLAEFQAAAAYSTTASAYGLLKTMLDRGTIVRTVEGLNRHSYAVAADAVKTPGDQPARATVMPAAGQKTLGEYAREYAWKENSDSLRGFVKYMDGVELDLRRMIQGGGY